MIEISTSRRLLGGDGKTYELRVVDAMARVRGPNGEGAVSSPQIITEEHARMLEETLGKSRPCYESEKEKSILSTLAEIRNDIGGKRFDELVKMLEKSKSETEETH